MKLKYPSTIPIFPLSGVIFFPGTSLPLNIFEERYLALVNDCIKSQKIMGMVQSKESGGEIFKVGCLGKISDYSKTDDGRILINLVGLTRFKIKKEINNKKLYREFDVVYDDFFQDSVSTPQKISEIEFNKLIYKTKKFLKKNGLFINWKEFTKLERSKQINTLAMVSPISVSEKQKLLETITTEKKIETLYKIIEFNMYDQLNNGARLQ